MTSQRDDALTTFMQNLGLRGFNISATNRPWVNNLIIGGGRYVLDVEEISDERGVVLALFSKVPTHQLYDNARQLLLACYYNKFLPMVVQVGLRGDDTLVLMVRVEQVSPQTLSRAFDLMFQLYTEIEA
ncbi:MAG: hypothetical protein GDA45_05015 [Chromatiales bacterium]|nr:hypothetical protein [Chromatiales bacterium]